MIEHPRLRGRAVGAARDRARPRRARPDASRCSRSPTATSACAATSTRASRTACPGTYLNGFYEIAPAAVRRGRLRLPRGRPDGRQRHQRQAHPAARRRRAVRRPLRRAARATSACSTCAPGVLRRACRLALAGRRRVRVTVDAPRLVRPARDRGDPLRGRAARRRRSASSSSPSWSPTSTAARRRADDPRAAAALSAPLVRRGALRARRAAGRARALAPAQQRPADGGRRWTTWSTGPDGTDDRRREPRPDLGARDVAADARARRAAADRQVPRLRLVEPALAAGGARPGPRQRWPRRGTPAGTGCARRSATYLDDFWDARRRRDRGRRRAPAGRPLRAVPRAAGRRARRAAGDPRQGPDRPGLRRPRVLGHRDLRAAGAHLHGARRGRATRCAGATRRSTSPASARASSASRGAAFPWRTIRGQECSGYWPAGTAAFHVNADIADAVRALPARRPTTRSSSATSGLELLVETARLWRSLGHHDADGALPHRRRHRARTSTARSPTTTSTRT